MDKTEKVEEMVTQIEYIYTKHLAKSMGTIKAELLGTLLFGGSFRDIDKPYEIKANFYD